MDLIQVKITTGQVFVGHQVRVVVVSVYSALEDFFRGFNHSFIQVLVNTARHRFETGIEQVKGTPLVIDAEVDGRVQSDHFTR